MVCGLEGLNDYLKVVNQASHLKFLALSENDEGDVDTLKEFAATHGMEMIIGDFTHKKDLKAMFRLRVGHLYFK